MTEENKQEIQHPQYILIPDVLQPQNSQQSVEVDLSELWSALWADRWLITSFVFMFAIFSVVYAIKQPNIYKATAVLAPAGDSGSGGLGKLAGQFGGLASLAGIDLGGGEVDKTGIALEVLKSRVFIEYFIEKHNLLIPLMAMKDWDQKTDQLIIDEDIYNIQTNEWVRDVSFPKTPKPSSWEAFEEFREIVSSSTDKQTGMIIISIEYFSPEIAKNWLTLLIAEINEKMREIDKSEAQNSIDFLNDKLINQQLAANMQSVFYKLIEEQTKTMMLTEVSKEYVFKTIDPANAPDQKAEPRRVLICVLGTMLGGVIGLLIVIIRYFKNKHLSK